MKKKKITQLCALSIGVLVDIEFALMEKYRYRFGLKMDMKNVIKRESTDMMKFSIMRIANSLPGKNNLVTGMTKMKMKKKMKIALY